MLLQAEKKLVRDRMQAVREVTATSLVLSPHQTAVLEKKVVLVKRFSATVSLQPLLTSGTIVAIAIRRLHIASNMWAQGSYLVQEAMQIHAAAAAAEFRRSTSIGTTEVSTFPSE